MASETTEDISGKIYFGNISLLGCQSSLLSTGKESLIISKYNEWMWSYIYLIVDVKTHR